MGLGKIPLFQGDPFLKEALGEGGGVAFQDALLLICGVNIQEYRQIVVGSEGGVHGVGTLDDGQLLGGDGDGGTQGPGGAIERAVAHGLSLTKWAQNLLQEPFAIQVTADLGQAVGGALLGAQEEIIHVEHGAAVQILQEPRKGGFARGAAALNGDHRRDFFLREGVDAGKEGEEGDIFVGDDAVGGGVGGAEGVGMVNGRIARLRPRGELFFKILGREGEQTLADEVAGDTELILQVLATRGLGFGGAAEQLPQGFGGETLLQAGEVDPAIGTVQGIGRGGGDAGKGGVFPADVGNGGILV